MKLHFKSLIRDISLLIKQPRGFLWSYTYPANEYVHIEPFSPEVKRIGTDLVKKLNQKYPELKVNFLGSASLGIAGQRDIDLIAESKPRDFSNYLPGIVEVMGKPEKIRPDFVEWHIKKDRCAIELLLISPDHPIAAGPLESYKILRTNPQKLKEYENLKLKSDGKSIREYKRVRMAFFEKITQGIFFYTGIMHTHTLIRVLGHHSHIPFFR